MKILKKYSSLQESISMPDWWCNWALAYICWYTLDSSAVRICRLRDSGIICSWGYLRRRRSITWLLRFSDFFYLAEVGADMPVGQLWCWTYFLIRSRSTIRIQEQNGAKVWFYQIYYLFSSHYLCRCTLCISGAG